MGKNATIAVLSVPFIRVNHVSNAHSHDSLPVKCRQTRDEAYLLSSACWYDTRPPAAVIFKGVAPAALSLREVWTNFAFATSMPLGCTDHMATGDLLHSRKIGSYRSPHTKI